MAKLLFVGRGRAMKICRLTCPKFSLMISRATDSRMAHMAAGWHYPLHRSPGSQSIFFARVPHSLYIKPRSLNSFRCFTFKLFCLGLALCIPLCVFFFLFLLLFVLFLRSAASLTPPRTYTVTLSSPSPAFVSPMLLFSVHEST